MAISLIYLLVVLLVTGVLLYCARLLITAFAIQQPFATVLYVVLILVCLLMVLQVLGIWGPWGTITIR